MTKVKFMLSNAISGEILKYNINLAKEEFGLTFEQAKEVICADIVCDRKELDLVNLVDLVRNDYSIADCLNKNEKNDYYVLLKKCA